MKHTVFILLSIFYITGCKNSTNSTPIKPNPSGKSGEIIVVVPDNLWKGKVGDTIFFALSRAFDVLPQDEAFFNIVHIPKSGFKNIFKTHRNIIFINIGSEYPKASVKEERDKWAKYQLIYEFYAPDTSSFFKIWDKNISNIMANIYDEELARYSLAYKKNLNQKAIEKIKENFKISMEIPIDYNLDVLKKHFAWISKETNVSSQGIFIYDYPYVDSNTFTTDFIIKKRDEITKLNVPGPNEGTYMQTEKRVPFKVEKMNLNGNFTYVVRGLWYTENYFLGGPFVSYSILDTQRNRVVTVEAYVYAGKQDKKLYVWQTEAILRSVKILKK